MDARRDTPEQAEFREYCRRWLQENRPAAPPFRLPEHAIEVMTEEQRRECDAAAKLLLPPAGVATRYNGQLLAPRQPLASTEATLATEVADAEGFLRRSQRRTRVEIHEPAAGETPTLYELGIPVVESGLPWHVNVGQKVPLSFERDNVPPAYQSKLRALVLEEMHAKLQTEDANQAWVRDAIQHHGADLSGSAIGAVVQARFGDKRVSYDPSDPEANSRAVAAGYTVVHGGQMSAAEWEAVRRTGAIRPAGQVTPSPKPFDPEGKPLKFVAQQDWSEAMRAVAQLARELAGRVLKVPVTVKIANEVGWPFAATYGDGTLILNLGRLGHRWFNGPLAPVVDLLVHEFGHHYEMNHLAKEYHDALTRLAGEVTAVALSEPALFARWMREEATA